MNKVNNNHAMEDGLADTNVEISLQTFVNETYIDEYSPDIVVVATVSQPLVPPIKGIHNEHVYMAQEVLLGGILIDSLAAGKVLIIGVDQLG